MKLLPLLALLVACGHDADHDGSPEGVDCDDSDPEVFPGAVEVCNDVDDDCDGLTDPPGSDGTHAFYADRDADGWGDRGGAVKTCDPPIGYVPTWGDCDDEDARVNPDAAEQPGDGVDDDCDTATPDGA
ncbi:MAG TPA: MopE-related protein [Myxococcota bacterium]|nr:MopE-related protein [Myxococcota bacterium]